MGKSVLYGPAELLYTTGERHGKEKGMTTEIMANQTPTNLQLSEFKFKMRHRERSETEIHWKDLGDREKKIRFE